jgi:hypothetical protein
MQGHHDNHIPVEELSTRELLEDLVEHTRLLARTESAQVKGDVAQGKARLSDDVAYARREIGSELGRAKQAGTSIAIGGVIAHAAVYFLLGALALALWAIGLPLWVGALIVGVLAGVIGGLMLKGGASRLKRVHLTPRNTIQRLKEDKRWMTERFRAMTHRIRASA